MSHHDPFADAAQHPQPGGLHFQEPERPYRHPNPSSHSVAQHYDSTSNLNEFGQHYDDEDYEKAPLGAGQGFTGGFYPPGPKYAFGSLSSLFPRTDFPL